MFYYVYFSQANGKALVLAGISLNINKIMQACPCVGSLLRCQQMTPLAVSDDGALS